MQALALSLLLLSSGGGLGAGAGARLLLQSPWSPQGYHRNGYDERRIECKPQAALATPAALTISACVHSRRSTFLKKKMLHTLAGRDQQWYDSQRGSWRYASCQALKARSCTSLMWRQVASCDVLLTRAHSLQGLQRLPPGLPTRLLQCAAHVVVVANYWSGVNPFWFSVRHHTCSTQLWGIIKSAFVAPLRLHTRSCRPRCTLC